MLSLDGAFELDVSLLCPLCCTRSVAMGWYDGTKRICALRSLRMNEIKCPHCGKVFQVDERGFADILRQVRTAEFDKEIAQREGMLQEQNAQAVKLALLRPNRMLRRKPPSAMLVSLSWKHALLPKSANANRSKSHLRLNMPTNLKRRLRRNKPKLSSCRRT